MEGLNNKGVTISGLLKLTLLDYPEHLACTVFLQGCNFRCPFCYNSSLISEKQAPGYAISESEFFEFLSSRKNKLDGVAITGGEPLIQKDIKNFILKIKEMGFKVKLDTNGSFPDILQSLIEENMVDYVAMDIKNSYEKYSLTAGNTQIVEKVKRSVEILLQGKVDYEFRTTVVKELHSPSDMIEIGKAIKGAKRYFIQNYQDKDSVLRKNLHPLEKDELEALLNEVKKYVPSSTLRGID